MICYLALVIVGRYHNVQYSFLNPTILKQLDLPVPNRETTPQVLEPLDLSTTTEPSKPLQAYRKLYGLHLL